MGKNSFRCTEQLCSMNSETATPRSPSEAWPAARARQTSYPTVPGVAARRKSAQKWRKLPPAPISRLDQDKGVVVRAILWTARTVQYRFFCFQGANTRFI